MPQRIYLLVMARGRSSLRRSDRKQAFCMGYTVTVKRFRFTVPWRLNLYLPKIVPVCHRTSPFATTSSVISTLLDAFSRLRSRLPRSSDCFKSLQEHDGSLRLFFWPKVVPLKRAIYFG